MTVTIHEIQEKTSKQTLLRGYVEHLEERRLLANTITPEQMVRSVISLDAYQRGYNTPKLDNGDGVYDFKLGRSSKDMDFEPGFGYPVKTEDSDFGFFAQEYVSPNETIIGYRGTDDGFDVGDDSDQVNGFGVGLGKPHGPQASAAIDFYNFIAGGSPFTSDDVSDVEVTGQSLGGGLAGYVAALYQLDATIFSHMPFRKAAEGAYQIAILSIYFPDARQVFGEFAFDAASFFYWWIDADAVRGLPPTPLVQYDDEAIEMVRDIWGTTPLVDILLGSHPSPVPDTSAIKSFHLKDEFLSLTRKEGEIDETGTRPRNGDTALLRELTAPPPGKCWVPIVAIVVLLSSSL
ncbi:hypothetical protein ACFL2H_13530 [Planctomycetota bacterium]